MEEHAKARHEPGLQLESIRQEVSETLHRPGRQEQITTLSRSSGIILHPTSLPGPDGIGDFGPEAYRWVDFLDQAGCSLWQVLPLGPTGYGDSPYQCFSAFAGNPYLISPTLLLDAGLLTAVDLKKRPAFPVGQVDYGAVIDWKSNLLDKAFIQFKKKPFKVMLHDFERFYTAQKSWLEDFALFMAIKEIQGRADWGHWPVAIRARESEALKAFSKHHHPDIQRQIFRQFLFHQQWSNLKRYANQKGIRILGDMPLYIAYDSADCWSQPELFSVNKTGKLSTVAGVPPDYFSPTGQLWGNPLYRWQTHERLGYAWWIARTQSALTLFDFVRIDHFRGFTAFWEVKSSSATAENGHWRRGPGLKFFKALEKAIQPLPVIAEDLGVITADVVALRDACHLPGMKILQFAFSEPGNAFLPHHYTNHCVAYTGTHDNDTCRGWYLSASEDERDFCRRYLACSSDDIAWEMIRAVWASVADLALAPVQDLLSLDTHARMNYPSRPTGNWSWRLSPGAISPELSDRLQAMNTIYSRNKNC